jgi:hypothetical protein
MSIPNLKKQIYKAINTIEDQSFLEAVYTILNDKLKESEFKLTREQKAILDLRRKNHRLGKSKSYTLAETRALATAHLKK